MELDINKIKQEVLDNIDAKDFSKSSLQDLTSKRAIWIKLGTMWTCSDSCWKEKF